MAKLKKCKGCGAEISKKAKSCPKCGEPAPKKTSLLTWLVLILIVLWAILKPLSTTTEHTTTKELNATEKAKMEALAIEKEKNLPKNLVDLDFQPSKGGFGNIMISDFTITNKNKFDIKDITIKCSQISNSGARLGKNEKTIYEIVPANKTKTFKKFNMGFMHSQTSSSACEIVSFTINDIRVWTD